MVRWYYENTVEMGLGTLQVSFDWCLGSLLGTRVKEGCAVQGLGACFQVIAGHWTPEFVFCR